jgi:hypothetical protein
MILWSSLVNNESHNVTHSTGRPSLPAQNCRNYADWKRRNCQLWLPTLNLTCRAIARIILDFLFLALWQKLHSNSIMSVRLDCRILAETRHNNPLSRCSGRPGTPPNKMNQLYQGHTSQTTMQVKQPEVIGFWEAGQWKLQLVAGRQVEKKEQDMTGSKMDQYHSLATRL